MCIYNLPTLFIYQLLLLGLFNFGICKAQKGYIVGENFISSGLEILGGGRKSSALICRIKHSDSIQSYLPGQISAYGFLNGKRYESKVITTKKGLDTVFLQKLESGRVSLYFYKGTGYKVFFLEPDSGMLIPIRRNDRSNERNYKNTIKLYLTDCDKFDRLITVANFNRPSLAELVKRYNNVCNMSYFPFVKFGFIGSVGQARLKISSLNTSVYLKDLNYDLQWRRNFGFFVDYPFIKNNFSIHTELYFEDTYFEERDSINNRFLDLIIDCNSLNIPVMIRYNLPLSYIRPFFNAGLTYSWNYKITEEKKTVTYVPHTFPASVSVEDNIYALNQLSLVAGIGSEIDLWSGHIIDFELRYNWGVITDSFKYFKNEWKIILAFNL